MTSLARAAWTVACGLAAALAAVADARWGGRYSLRLLVFLPILAAAARGGPGAPFLVGTFGAVVWAAAVRRIRPADWSDAALAWETAVRAVMWILPAVAVARWRRTASRARLQAGIDALTGLLNRRGFLDQLPRLLQDCTRDGRPLTIAYLDADGFKAVNDQYGHGRGDAVLKAAAAAFRTNTRQGDLLGRLGGDEFVLALTGLTPEDAQRFVVRMQAALRAAINAVPADVTFSAGVVTYLAPPDDPERLLQSADRLMYAAKSAGRGETRFETHPQIM